jgi:hypothetical protein
MVALTIFGWRLKEVLAYVEDLRLLYLAIIKARDTAN